MGTLAVVKHRAIVAMDSLATSAAHKLSVLLREMERTRPGRCSVSMAGLEIVYYRTQDCTLKSGVIRYWKPENYSEHPYECCNKCATAVFLEQCDELTPSLT